MSNPFDFSDLAASDEQIANDTRRKDKVKQKFECIECAGSGLWQGGRRNVHGNANCWTCGGKGYVLTDPRKLRENRIKRATKKIDLLAEFCEQHADVIRVIGMASEWSSFAADLIRQLNNRPWSEKQLAAARSMAAKVQANEARRKEERSKAAKEAEVQVDLTPIRTMFETAVANGSSKPVYRAEGLIINRAPNHGRNPGALYVKDVDADYQGKVIETTFHPTRTALANVAERLQIIASNPLEAAVRYGRETGRCACCGRQLTNKLSIELGIGPICRDKWGL